VSFYSKCKTTTYSSGTLPAIRDGRNAAGAPRTLDADKMTLEKGFYVVNDEELFLFATNGFWDRQERMDAYQRVKARKLPDDYAERLK
jgi:hypothetical protein